MPMLPRYAADYWLAWQKEHLSDCYACLGTINSTIGSGTKIDKGIIAENVVIGSNCEVGVGEFAPSTYDARVYNADLATIGENSIIPDNVKIGRNTAIYGVTEAGDYPDGSLPSGGAIIKEATTV